MRTEVPDVTIDTAPTYRSRADELRASPPMFRWPWLDRLSRVHHTVPLLIFIPAIAGLLLLGMPEMGALATFGALVGGYLFWTLFEYWLHRLVFHFEPDHGLGARLHWIIHGVHHDHPNDPKRLVMPPAVSVPLALVMYALFALVLGTPTAYLFTAAFLTGYLVYDMMHFYLHHHRPKTALGRRLRELHMRHHFEDDTVGYGISAPWWDRVFGTYYQRRHGAERP